MSKIPNAANYVPLMFQAQTKGRSQVQFISNADVQDCQRWASEWTQEVYPHPPQWGREVQTKTYKLNWRFVTNGGQDEGIIRPVIGAFGLPFYPGSSMKGIFCGACTEEQKRRYWLTKETDKPSLLRFHGGYPINSWTQNLVDIVHPQQGWQVKTAETSEKPSRESGLALISLYQPTLQFGISSASSNTDWEEVWQIWERALGFGIGCRVSSGYGLPQACLAPNGEIDHAVDVTDEVLCRFFLKGQGQAPHLINEQSEFRPNIFRGALRGHVLRLFGGLTNADSAEDLVETLFGGIRGQGKQGLLKLAFQHSSLELGTFAAGFREPTYNVTGELRWLLTSPPLSDEVKDVLKRLVSAFMNFAMLLGGFGKSWRRADHRLFYRKYYDSKRSPLIGCHWQWDKSSLRNGYEVKSINDVTRVINNTREVAQEWMLTQSVTPDLDQRATWREAWHPDNVQIWGRLAEGKEDSKAIKWLHQPYQKQIRDRYTQQRELTIKNTSVTGQIGQIGRLWHRMYPRVIPKQNPKDPNGKRILGLNDDYFELLTLFDDGSKDFADFLEFLKHEASLQSEEDAFQQLW